MDRSLWLLAKLRFVALVRRWRKNLSGPRGIIMLVITASLLTPYLITVFVSPNAGLKPPQEEIRRYAPLGIFAFTVASLLFSGGEQALYYSPAEVTFLFAGPYRRRQLLAFKLITTVLLCLTSAFFFAGMTKAISAKLASGFLGSFALILFLQLLQMVVGLASSTVGVLAWSRGRRLLVTAVVVVVGLAIASVGGDLGGAGPLEALKKVEGSPVAWVVLTPFRWFVNCFTSERIWPDLALWGSLALLVDGVLLGLVFAFDASYLEAAAAKSARRFSKMQRMGAGGGAVRSSSGRASGRFRFRPPAVPWWGGVGPNFWRQMTGAVGDPGRLAGVVAMISMVPIIMIFVSPRGARQAEPLPYLAMGVIAWLSIILSVLVPYDFRGDIDVMEELKSLPIPPSRLALGQVLTPTLLATLAQSIAMLIVINGLGGDRLVAWAFLAFLLPVNLFFFAVENLLFLWYPSRLVAGQFDVVAVGRQMLFMLAKVLGLGLGAGLAALVGAGVYFATGRQVVPALALAWLTLSASALALIPLVGVAFRNFDVAGDIPA